MILAADVLETLQEKNVEIFDAERGVIRCKYCGEDWVMEKNYVNVIKNNGHIELDIVLDWSCGLPDGWWKCPEGCWRVV